MARPISNKHFLKIFKAFFEELHHKVTGSRKVAELTNATIYEGIIPEKGKINFYLFHGNKKERALFFPKEKVRSFAMFRSFPSTIHAKFDENSVDFLCEFGYVFTEHELIKGWEHYNGSNGAAEWLAVNICSHEIRHEIQFYHSLNPSQFQTIFPEASVSIKPEINWNKTTQGLRKLYQSYIKRALPVDDLARELDAIITSYFALQRWFNEDENDRQIKLQRLKKIILS